MTLEEVEPAFPPPGFGAIAKAVDYCSVDATASLRDPSRVLLDHREVHKVTRNSKVLATEGEWCRIVMVLFE